MSNRFTGFDQEARGPWEPGWYGGVIVAEYEKTGDFAAVHRTEDKPTDKGSRNLKLCVKLVRGKETKDLNYTINYRPEALEADRLEELKQMRVANKGNQTWADRLAQRDNLSLTRLHEIEKAELPLEDNGDGGFDVEALIGKAADFRINVCKMIADGKGGKESVTVDKALLHDPNTTDEERSGWFNRITGVAALDSKTNSKAKAAGK